MHRTTLMWAGFNIPMAAIMAILYWTGPLRDLIEQDRTGVTAVILLVALVVVLTMVPRAITIDRYRRIVDEHGTHAAGRAMLGERVDPSRHGDLVALEHVLYGPHAIYAQIGNILTGIGFLFTLVGITWGLSAVAGMAAGNRDAFADPAMRAEMFFVLISWLKVALHTSVAGLVGALWIFVGRAILNRGADSIMVSVAAATDEIAAEVEEGSA